VGRLTIDPEVIRQLAALLEETGLDEIEVADGGRHVRVGRAKAPVVTTTAAPTSAAAPPASPAAPVAEAPASGPPAGAVTSPMVGTVYLSPEPGSPPFVKVGDQVETGQTLLIIEAMKVMNPIRAPRGGRVGAVMVANGAPVEFGETLLVLA
jgi:acetyl-CoA carboxylase biotin carboxyl carrier protein